MFESASRWVLAGLVLAVVLTPQPSAMAQETLVWSASFDSGSFRPDYNGASVLSCGGQNEVSSTVAHSGQYGGYHFRVGSASGTSTCRAYFNENLVIMKRMLANFRLDMWIYVPSAVNGQKVTLTDWVSFASFQLGGSNGAADQIFTVDSSTQRRIQLWVTDGHKSITQAKTSVVQWQFDTWLKLTVEAYVNRTINTIIVYQDDVRLLSYTGSLGAPGLLSYMHFGLYIGKKQGAFAIYNDDISLTELTSVALVVKRR